MRIQEDVLPPQSATDGLSMHDLSAQNLSAQNLSAQDLSTQDLSARGWRHKAAALVTGLLLILAVSGCWIYLAPFSRFSEVQVLVHVAAGLALLIPYAYYQVQHLLIWRGQKSSVVRVVGYLLMTMVLACVISGLIVSVQATFAFPRSEFMSQTHVISGIGISGLLLIHVIAALQRRWPMMKRNLELKRGLRIFLYRVGGLCGIGFLIVSVASVSLPRDSYLRPIPEKYSLPDYAQNFEEYQGSPYAPSYARTSTGSLIDSNLLSQSESCGTSGCHEQIYNEWLPSAHRFSAMNPPFQQVQRNFAADREVAETRYCAGCHDPISLFAGAKDIHNLDLSAPGMQEGCSCVVCHSISSVDQRGNGDYILTPPKKYLWENEDGWRKGVSDFLIRAYPRQHLADYDRNVLRSPEFCGACHKQFIPEALNHTGLSPGQNQYDEWRESHWNTGDMEGNLNCIDCHMRLVQDSRDPGRGEGGTLTREVDDGKHRHHGTIGTNVFIPELLKLENWEKHCRLTREWMKGETVIEEIASRWPAGPVVEIQLVAPPKVQAGESIELRAVIVNRKAGHNFLTGPLDFMRAWIHLRAEDSQGQILAEWGAIDPQTREITDDQGQPQGLGTSRSEGSLMLGAEPLDQQGNVIRRHELWNKAGGRGQRIVFPTHSDSQSYTIPVPHSAEGSIRIKADLNFRRYRQEFLDLVLPEMEKDYGFYQPTVTKSSDSVVVEIVPTELPAEAPIKP